MGKKMGLAFINITMAKNLKENIKMEIQGREEDIDQVILRVEQGRYVLIENMRVKDLPVVEGERYFITE